MPSLSHAPREGLRRCAHRQLRSKPAGAQGTGEPLSPSRRQRTRTEDCGNILPQERRTFNFGRKCAWIRRLRPSRPRKWPRTRPNPTLRCWTRRRCVPICSRPSGTSIRGPRRPSTCPRTSSRRSARGRDCLISGPSASTIYQANTCWSSDR